MEVYWFTVMTNKWLAICYVAEICFWQSHRSCYPSIMKKSSLQTICTTMTRQQIDIVDLVSVAASIVADSCWGFSFFLFFFPDCYAEFGPWERCVLWKWPYSSWHSQLWRRWGIAGPWKIIPEGSSRSVEWNESGKRQTTTRLNVAFDCSNLTNSNCTRARNKL